ncbi:hypothetical protein RhiLY_09850 [Ceratobasidium sp. AG-Ba]|nr:hypothetical protein RhiLY_09850 [Ceratobasidium sp. AG-Ba]
MADIVIRRQSTRDVESGGEKFVEEESKPLKSERDMQAVTVEGFNTLGVVSTFIAGVEASCLGLTSNTDGHNLNTIEAINALLLIGIFLSTFGAITSLFAGRWFNLLQGPEVELLDHQWSCARPSPAGKSLIPEDNENLSKVFRYTPEGFFPSEHIRRMVNQCNNHKRNLILARAIFLPLQLIILGFFSFIAGMVVYVWEYRPIGTAIACTFVTFVGLSIIAALHVDFETMGALNKMSFQRPRI